MSFSGRFTRWFVAAILFGTATLGSAWDRSKSIEDTQPSNFLPQTVAYPDANGLWVSGYVNNVAMPVLLRYAADGSPQAIYYEDGIPFALADGGALSLGANLRRYDETGRLLWSKPLPSNCEGSCANAFPTKAAVDGAGNIWLSRSDTLSVIATGDGTTLTDIQLADDMHIRDFVADPATDCIYILGWYGDINAYPANMHAAVRKIDSTGQTLWSWNAKDGGNASFFSNLLLAKDGNLYVHGAIVGGEKWNLFSASLSAAGSERWVRTFPEVFASAFSIRNYSMVFAVATATQSDSYVAVDRGWDIGDYSSTERFSLLKISAAGLIAFRRDESVQSSCYLNYSDLASAPNGDALFLLSACVDKPGKLLRLDTNGNPAFSAISWGSQLRTYPDGSVLVMSPWYKDYGVHTGFERFDPSGVKQASLATQNVLRAGDDPSNVATSPDGMIYRWAFDASGDNFVIRAYAPDGRLRWSKLDADPLGSPVIAADDNQLCVSGIGPYDSTSYAHVTLRCYAAADGSIAFTTPLLGQYSGVGFGMGPQPFWQLQKIDDGSSLVVYRGLEFGSLHHALVDANGKLLHDTEISPQGGTPLTGPFDINAKGVAGFMTPEEYQVVLADGSMLYRTSRDVADGNVFDMRTAGDGSAVLLSTVLESGAYQLYAIRIDTKGNVTWRRHMQALPAIYSFGNLVRFSADAAFIAISPNRFTPDSSGTYNYYAQSSRLYKLALADGAVAWSRMIATQPRPDLNAAMLLPDEPQNSIVFVTGSAGHVATQAFQNGTDFSRYLSAIALSTNRIRTQVFDVDTGESRVDRVDACGTDICRLASATIDAKGSLNVVASTGDARAGNGVGLYVIDDAASAQPGIPLVQSALKGAWYAPYETGQGFVFDYIPEASTIFMPWFTFDSNGRNDSSDPIWYVLQGVVAATATEATLDIYSSTAGSFNAGKTAAIKVGTAQLRFTDCDKGSLRYELNPDTQDGASGVIALTRLTPRVSGCLLADGSVQAPDTIVSPALGFEPGQSGSWYNTDTSGQGFEFGIVPRSADSAGLVFGTWFTFDPAGKSNDSLNKHWFALQGDFSQARNGEVEVGIFQSLGGTFDGRPTQNGSRVGLATLRMNGCTQARLEYRFDDSVVAHAFKGLSGGIDLFKTNGCDDR